MYCALLTLAWFVGTIYATIPLFALIVRPFAKFLRARRSRLLVIIPSWFGMTAVVYFLTWRWREALLYRAPTAWLAAVFLFAAAIRIYPRSRLHFFHIQVVGRRELEPGRERRLITSGIRQHIRHPIYLAHLCMLLALTVGSGEIVLYGLTVFALLTGWPMMAVPDKQSGQKVPFQTQRRSERSHDPCGTPSSKERPNNGHYEEWPTCYAAIEEDYDNRGQCQCACQSPKNHFCCKPCFSTP